MKRFFVGLLTILLVALLASGLLFIWYGVSVWLVSVIGLEILVAALWLPAILLLIAFIYDIGCKFID